MECNPYRYYTKTLGAFFLLCLMFYLPVSAQEDENAPLRLELPSEKDWYEYSYLPLSTHGVVLINRGKLIHTDTAVWNFTFYDTNFVKKHTLQKPLLNNATLVTSHFSGSHFFLLFQSSSIRKTTRWFVIEGALTPTPEYKKDLKLSEIFPNMQAIKSMSAVGHNLILFSSDKNENGYCFYDLDKESMTLKVDLKEQYTEFVITDTTHKRVFICNSATLKNQEGITFGFTLNEFQYDGSNQKEYNFPQYKDYSYKSARLVKTDTASYLIIGTYSNESEKKNGNIHTGVYTVTYKNGIFGYPNFFNYTALKIKDSQALLKAQGNNLNLQLVIGDIYSNHNQYGFVTEVFYPEYSTTNYYSPGSYYASTPVSTFDGYRFLNAYVTTFDKEGNLLWDNFMPINNMLTQSLYPKVGLHIDEKKNGYIYYLNGNAITSTLINNYTVIEPILTEKLVTLFPKDIVESNAQIKIERWYGDTYLVTGYQVIRNQARGKGGKRFVFFLNRLQYR